MKTRNKVLSTTVVALWLAVLVYKVVLLMSTASTPAFALGCLLVLVALVVVPTALVTIYR